MHLFGFCQLPTEDEMSRLLGIETLQIFLMPRIAIGYSSDKHVVIILYLAMISK